MAQVRICMSCGTVWQAGSMAAVDGFCLQCPGELGPLVEADSPQARAAVKAAAPSDSGLAPALPTTVTPNTASPVDSGATTKALKAFTSRVDDSATTRKLKTEPARESSSTTEAVKGPGGDDLEPPPPTRGSAALTKIRYATEPLAPGQTIRRQAQSVTPEEVEVNIDPLSGEGTATGTAAGGSSRRHPEAGSGDTTAVVVTGPDGQPLARQTAIGRIAGVTSGLPAKLARLQWHCRDCRVDFPPGAAAIGARRCSECGGKIEPELAPVAAGIPCLLLYDPDTRVRIGRFGLQRDVFLIGRLDPGSETFPDLNVNDFVASADARQVSRRQCEVQRDRQALSAAYYLAPLAGNSGVYVKGTLIEPGQRVKLEEQMVFGIGGDRIFLRYEANPAP